MSAYKNISSQDYSIIPFNANKQYNFASASLSPNQITYISSSWTSESVDLYNSENIKYFQIDHLFYKNYKTDIGNKFGNINYLKQKRVLYGEANILSIPAGFYGHHIKPGSLTLLSGPRTAIDDSFGNLIISGTNVDDYVTDPRSILLDIGPVKGFKKYDLNTIENYVLDGFRPNSSFYRKGKRKVNTVHAPQLFKNGTFTGIADVVPAAGNDQYGPLFIYNNSGSASIENEKLVIKTHPTASGRSNVGALFTHTATAGTPYQMSFFTEGDTGSIYLSQAGYSGFATSTPPPNKTTTINYVAPTDGNVSIYFRANKNGQPDSPGTSSYDNITIKERGIDGYSTLFKDHDDSYFLNNINYKKILFSSSSLYTSDGHFPVLDFNGINSEIKINHNTKFNFNPGDEFSIEFWVNVKNLDLSDEVHLIGKSTTKTIIPSPLEGTSGTYPLNTTGSFQSQNINAEPQYPFEIYIKDKNNTPNIHFRKSDGNIISETFTPIKTGSFQHIVCRLQNSQLGIGINGSILDDDSIDYNYSNDYTINSTSNNANLYIGNKGGKSNYLSGSLSQIKIFNKALTTLQTTNHYKSSNGSPYIGNIFYPNGLAVITHPDYRLFLSPTRGGGIGAPNSIINSSQVNSRFIVGDDSSRHPFGLSSLQFQGSHLIYEYEYQCTIDEHEFNHTLNTSIRKNSSDIKDFATSSVFKPYITTIGLYNEDNELLVVGKLGQPLRTSNETDTTIVLRWDT